MTIRFVHYKKGKSMKLKNFAKVFSVAAVLALAMALMVGCSSSSKSESGDYTLIEDGKLKVAMSLGFEPYEYIEDGENKGLGVAVAEEVAKRLGLECEITNTNFDAILTAVAGGEQYDVGISSFTITPERKDVVDFTTPYCVVDQAVAVVDGKYTSVDQLAGLKVTGQSGTTGYDYALENVSENMVPLTEATACFASVLSGDAQALVMDLPVVEAYIAKSYPELTIIEKIATNEEYGIAVNKDNTGLKEAINEVLAEMEKDGTLKKLQDEHLA